MLRFRQIEAFRYLMQTGSSVGAARQMHVTQPAISRLIADLESDVGFALFDRNKGRLLPTPAAIRFYRAVEENFLGLARLKQVADTIRQDTPESLVVACLPVLSTVLLPAVLREFYRYRPTVPVDIYAQNTPEILARLQDRKADVALGLALPPVAGIETEALLETPVLCAMPVGHPLSRLDLVRPQDLDGLAMVGWLPDGSAAYREEQMILDKAGVRPHYLVRTHTAHTRYAMVANGFGVSIVEPFAAQIWQANGVVLRPFESNIRYQYMLAYPSAGASTPLLAEFCDTVRKVAKSLKLVGGTPAYQEK